MYSPFQEVPSTPSMSIYSAVLRSNLFTPEAVVPDVIYNQANSPEQSRTVPGTPVPSVLPSSPWTPNIRSLTRSKTEKGRRYIYNPSLISRLYKNSPAGSKTPKEQVVPSTPLGGFLLPSTSSHTPRRTVTPKIHFHIPNVFTCEVQALNTDEIDAAGDRPRKKRKVVKKSRSSTHITPKSRPRGERREAIASFRRSSDVGQTSFGESSATNDFLDVI